MENFTFIKTGFTPAVAMPASATGLVVAYETDRDRGGDASSPGTTVCPARSR